jgi:hypothetical protein
VNPQIDPLILQKLQAFSQRRRQLIIRRGIYAAITTLLATMMIVAFIDWLFVLSDGVRWALSGAAYLAIIVVEWRSCWRLLVSAPGPRKLARLVEHAEPKLREDLLSAVELGEGQSGAIFDSEQFRGLVQADVAERVKKLDVEKLLPAELLRRYVYLAAGIGVACVVAFALTGFQFGTLMMRALLPMANFARVSKVQVKIIEPTPAEMRVPQGDTLPLVIELSGQRANKALLETFTPSGGREVVPMNPLGHDRFSATIQVGRENVFYRVRAGDALTKKYQLEAVARPAVVQFQKSYTFPAYSRLAPKVVTEENGDLAGLEGSEVELRLLTNQKVRDAELRIEQGKKNTVVPLTAQGDALVAKVPLAVSGIYRVHLVGAESGFENKFSPEYELRAQPDLVPQVELELPKQDLILPSNEIVDVRGSAADDLALAKVAQLVKINDGGWKETLLVQNSGAEAKVERRWDLFEQGVKPGDLVTMKLVATDLKGNKAESRPLQVTVTSTGFEVKRLQALAGQRQLYEALKAQHAAATVLAKKANEARQQFEKLPDGDAQRAQVLLPASAGVEEVLQKNADVMKQLAIVLREAVPGHQAANLALIGHLVARVGTNSASNSRALYEAVTANPTIGYARELGREAGDSSNHVEQRARRAVDLDKVFLTGEEIDVFNENLQVVAQEEERLIGLAHRAGTDAARWVPVAARLRVVLSEMRSLEELSGAIIEHGARWAPDRMRGLQKTLNKHRTTMEKALAAPPSGELLAPTLEMARAIGDLARQALEVRRDFRGPTAESVRDLLRETEPTYSLFEYLRGEVHRYFRNDKIPVEIGNALVAARWQARLGSLKARGDVEELRPDADTIFTNDVRLTSRVLQALADRSIGEKPETFSNDLQGIDKLFRVLEYGHEAAELHAAVVQLAVAERWEIYNPVSRTANPQDWGWIGERLRLLPEELGKALNSNEHRPLAQAAQKILAEAQGQPFTQALNREMDERFNPARPPVSAREQADLLAAYLQQALNLFRQPMDDARKALAKLAPTLAETMKQLAKKTEELKEKTTNQAQQAHEKLPDEAKADARDALAQQQRLNEKVDALKDALRADANQQNILKNEGRERARDADDALAMLKEPPVRAEENLQRAAKSEVSQAQEQALNQAAEQQQKLAKALDQLAEHYEAMEQGKADETRMALRETEKENGIKEQLDQQFAKAEELAKMAQATPEELLAQLEKALPQNPQMQQELSAISQNTLKSAADQLKQASGKENEVAKNVQKMAADEKALAAIQPVQPPNAANPPNAQTPNAPSPQPPAQPQQANAQPSAPQPNQSAPGAQPQNPPATAANSPQVQPTPQPNQPAQAPQPQSNPALAEAAKQQTPIGQTANQAAAEISRAGRHEARTENKVAGEQLQKLGDALQQTAEKQVPGAQEALQQAQQAAQAQQAVDAANSGLQKALGQLMAVANPGDPSAAEQAPAAAAQTPPGQQPGTTPGAKPTAATQPAPSPSAQPSAPANPPANSQNAQASKPAGSPPSAQPAAPQPGQQAQNSASKGQPASQSSSPVGAPPAGQPGQPSPSGPSGQAGEMAGAPASPQEQVWMARTLDALDAALNAPAPGEGQTAQAQPGQPQSAQASGNTSQAQQASPAQSPGGKPAPQSNSMAQAQSAMAAAAQAAAAAARAARSEAGAPDKPGQPQPGGLQALSKGGVQSADGTGPRATLAEAKNKAGEWGKLPKQMAEELTQGRQEGIAGEYRNQVETYYRVIAEKSKKQ